MQTVQLTKALPPSHGAGDLLMLPDSVARKLIAEGGAIAGSLPRSPFGNSGGFVPDAPPLVAVPRTRTKGR
jgi:hypothetical protein